MPLQLFLNDLSEPTNQLSREQSIELLKNLVLTVREVWKLDPNIELYSKAGVSHFSLGDGTTIASIRNDGRCVEESSFLKRISDRAPIKLSLVAPEEDDEHSREYKMLKTAPVHAEKEAVALGFAHLLNGIGLSAESHEFWKQNTVELSLFELDESGEVRESQISAHNVHTPNSITQRRETLLNLITNNISDGAELWLRREELLPNLKFIPRTRAQLERVRAGDPLLDQIWIKLSGINQAIGEWELTKSKSPAYRFNVRPESESRINQGLVEFNDCEGVARVFSLHCDLAPTECRIHFILEAKPTKRAIIGHIGRKLGIG